MTTAQKTIEIIAIGDELTSGRIQNTTSHFAARQFFDSGWDICAMNTIGDDPRRIGEALQRALRRADAVVVTGGLGSTDDDLTTEAVCSARGLPTERNAAVLAALRDSTEGEGPLPPGLEKLALLPRGAVPFDPSRRMSGYLLACDGLPVFFLPGVPEQMKVLLEEEVLPVLATWEEHHQLATCQRLYRLFAIEELEVNRRIAALRLPQEAQVGYYPVFPEVHVSLTVRDSGEGAVNTRFSTAAATIEAALGEALYGYDRDSLEQVTGHLLKSKGLSLATAESCTGGLIAERITCVPGSSEFFVGGAVSYANAMKSELLGVAPELIEKRGAVSHPVAEAMATGIRNRSGADFGLAVTGIAGPGGGSVEKPVGTVFIALADAAEITVKECHFSGDRNQIRQLSAATAIDMVRRRLLAGERR